MRNHLNIEWFISLLYILRLKKYRCIIYHLITISIRDISFKLFRSLRCCSRIFISVFLVFGA